MASAGRRGGAGHHDPSQPPAEWLPDVLGVQPAEEVRHQRMLPDLRRRQPVQVDAPPGHGGHHQVGVGVAEPGAHPGVPEVHGLRVRAGQPPGLLAGSGEEKPPVRDGHGARPHAGRERPDRAGRSAARRTGKGQDAGPGTDFDAIRRGFISITPIHVDLTRYQALDQVAGWVGEIAMGGEGETA